MISGPQVVVEPAQRPEHVVVSVGVHSISMPFSRILNVPEISMYFTWCPDFSCLAGREHRSQEGSGMQYESTLRLNGGFRRRRCRTKPKR